jgi:hypothetical protein
MAPEFEELFGVDTERCGNPPNFRNSIGRNVPFVSNVVVSFVLDRGAQRLAWRLFLTWGCQCFHVPALLRRNPLDTQTFFLHNSRARRYLRGKSGPKRSAENHIALRRGELRSIRTIKSVGNYFWCRVEFSRANRLSPKFATGDSKKRSQSL